MRAVLLPVLLMGFFDWLSILLILSLCFIEGRDISLGNGQFLGFVADFAVFGIGSFFPRKDLGVLSGEFFDFWNLPDAKFIKCLFGSFVNYELVKFVHLSESIRIGNRIFCAPTRSEPIRVLIELCFATRLHDLQDTLLYYSINNTRYSQRPQLSVWLRYFYSSYCLRLIPPELFLDELYKLILWHDCH